MERWNLIWKNNYYEKFTREQQMQMESENSLCLHFPPVKNQRPDLWCNPHINDKALQRISQTANGRIHDIIEAGNGSSLIRAVGRYNAFVIGMHNYYQMATHIARDVNRIDYQVFRTFELRTNMKLKQYVDGKGNQYIKDKYGKSSRLKEWRGFPIVPISYVQTVPPKMKRISVNLYTPEGRVEVHKNLRGMDLSVLYYIMRNPVMEQSIEYKIVARNAGEHYPNLTEKTESDHETESQTQLLS